VTIGWATAHPLWGVHPISDFAPVGNNFQARRKFVRAVRLPKSEKTMARNHLTASRSLAASQLDRRSNSLQRPLRKTHRVESEEVRRART
jgi:hypothetical protein